MSAMIRAVIAAENNSGPGFESFRQELARTKVQAEGLFETMSRPVAANGAFGRRASFRLQNLSYQTNDIVVGLASGQKAQTVMMQQGAQILQLYAGQGGIKTAFGDLGIAARGAIGIFSRLALPIGIAATAVGVLTTNMNRNQDVQVSFFDIVGGGWDLLTNKVKELGGPVLSALGRAWDWFSQTAGNVVQTLGNWIVGTVATVIDVSKLMWRTAQDMMSGDFSGLKDFGKDMSAIAALDMGHDWMGKLFEGLREAAQNRALARLAGDADKAAGATGKLGKALTTVNRHANNVKAAGQTLAETLTSAFSGIGSSIVDAFTKGGNVANNVLDEVMGRLKKLGNMLLDNALNSLLGNLFGSLFGGSPLGNGIGGGASWGGLQAFANGFSSGGYTGGMSPNAIAGVVHGGEYVLNAAATRRIGVGNLDAMNNGSGAARGVSMNVNIDARGAQQGVGAEIARALRDFSRHELPLRMRDINKNPYAVG